MALDLAQSLVTCRGFDIDDVRQRYLAWYRREGFDTGPIASQVFELMSCNSEVDAAAIVHQEVNGLTAGCNPMHRALPLAFLPGSIDGMGRAEAMLTHRHPLAGEASEAFLGITRCFLSDDSTAKPLAEIVVQLADRHTEPIREALLDSTARPLDRGGFAPEVLRAALHFVRRAKDFESAVSASIQFAGPSNYCPVIVGAFAGALYGESRISRQALEHCQADVVRRALALADALFALNS